MGAPSGAPAVQPAAARRPAGRSPDGDQRDLLPDPGGLGRTCRRASGTGRRSITGIAAGPWTGPGSRSWTGCGPGAMRARAGTGRSAPIPPWPGPISTRPAPAASRLLMIARGASANDRKSGREAIGRSRGGLTTKIHLAADLRCRPVARLTSCGQHGDSPRFVPLMDAIRIQRRGPGRPGGGPAARWRIRRTPPARTAPGCAATTSRP